MDIFLTISKCPVGAVPGPHPGQPPLAPGPPGQPPLGHVLGYVPPPEVPQCPPWREARRESTSKAAASSSSGPPAGTTAVPIPAAPIAAASVSSLPCAANGPVSGTALGMMQPKTPPKMMQSSPPPKRRTHGPTSVAVAKVNTSGQLLCMLAGDVPGCYRVEASQDPPTAETHAPAKPSPTVTEAELPQTTPSEPALLSPDPSSLIPTMAKASPAHLPTPPAVPPMPPPFGILVIDVAASIF